MYGTLFGFEQLVLLTISSGLGSPLTLQKGVRLSISSLIYFDVNPGHNKECSHISEDLLLYTIVIHRQLVKTMVWL